MKHSSRPFIFSASIPPSSCAVALASLRYMKSHPEIVQKLADNSSYFRNGLKERGVHIIESQTPVVPIYTYEAYNTLEKTRKAYDAGVYANPVLPPACAPNECLIRTSLMATHTFPLLDEAADILAAVMKENG